MPNLSMCSELHRILHSRHRGGHSYCVALLVLLVSLVVSCRCLAETVTSPNERIRVETTLDESEEGSPLTFSVYFDDELVLAESSFHFSQPEQPDIALHLQEASAATRSSKQESWKPVYGERNQIFDHYNQLTLHLRDVSAEFNVQIIFRCYDSAIAFQSTLTPHSDRATVAVSDECLEYNFLGNHTAWATVKAQGEYAAVPLSKLPGQTERPLVIQVDDETYVALGEAAVVDYARMKFNSSGTVKHGVQGTLSSPVASSKRLTTPWRVVMLGSSPGELLENNDIFLNLNAKCAIDDTSWIKPGKVLRDMTLTNAGARACIDFAKRYDFSFVEFDAGWYGNEYDDAADATTVTLDPKRTAGPLDLQQLVQEAASEGIGIIVYVNRRALERQLDELLPLFKKWGIAGVKYGFVNVGSQEWTSWLHEAIRKAAENELMVDVHDEYRPTGFSRTYPNFMTQEGVRGDEATPSSEQALTTLFTRSLAGATDFTICYFNPRVDEHWTHAHQLAKAVCFYSPWQFVFWYDTPLASHGQMDTIVETPELEFFASVPTTWDETKVVHGRIGEYAVIARRSGESWFVGALNNSVARSLAVPLDFLDSSKEYKATIYRDGESKSSPTGVEITELKVASTSTLAFDLKSNGGQALRIAPVDRDRRAAGPSSSSF